MLQKLCGELARFQHQIHGIYSFPWTTGS